MKVIDVAWNFSAGIIKCQCHEWTGNNVQKDLEHRLKEALNCLMEMLFGWFSEIFEVTLIDWLNGSIPACIFGFSQSMFHWIITLKNVLVLYSANSSMYRLGFRCSADTKSNKLWIVSCMTVQWSVFVNFRTQNM